MLIIIYGRCIIGIVTKTSTMSDFEIKFLFKIIDNRWGVYWVSSSPLGANQNRHLRPQRAAQVRRVPNKPMTNPSNCVAPPIIILTNSLSRLTANYHRRPIVSRDSYIFRYIFFHGVKILETAGLTAKVRWSANGDRKYNHKPRPFNRKPTTTRDVHFSLSINISTMFIFRIRTLGWLSYIPFVEFRRFPGTDFELHSKFKTCKRLKTVS